MEKDTERRDTVEETTIRKGSKENLNLFVGQEMKFIIGFSLFGFVSSLLRLDINHRAQDLLSIKS